jgi:predicted Zn-dependent protease
MIRFSSYVRRSGGAALVAGSTALAACGISTQQEVEMGAQYAAEINQQLPIVEDATLHNYINRLGRQIAAQGDRQLDYRFYIVNAEEVNAFAVPGGYVYLNRGLIEATDNQAELAGVLAHEIAHVEERHSVEQMEKAQGANLGLTAAYVLLGRQPSGVERAGVGVVGSAIFAGFSRDAEREADDRAVPLLVRSGIDPRGLTSFFEELLEMQQRQPSTVERWFSTHPTTRERIRDVEAAIARLPAASLRGLRTNTSDYASFQQRMRNHPAPRR